MILVLKSILQRPLDTGPIYRETLMGRFPVEPFNTFSNLVFLFAIVYFSIRVYPSIHKHRFLAFAIPILTIGYIGGTIYHATRSHEVWLLMDWMPIMILCLSVVFYFVFKLYETWVARLLALVIILGFSFGIRLVPMPAGLRISLGYIITSITILFPIIGYLIKTKGYNRNIVFLAFLCFGIAIIFRSIDTFKELAFLQMGTHWLWHFFGGISVFYLMKYIYEDNLERKEIK